MHRLSRPPAGGAIAVLSVLLAGPAHAAYTFTTINVPGATSGTVAYGINGQGQITGYFFDSTGSHGFIETAGNFVTINVPGAAGTQPTGINDAGQVTGGYGDGTGAHGFVYTSGIFTMPNVPGAKATFTTGINDSGQVTGIYIDSSGRGVHGFVNTSGSFATLDVPWATLGTQAYGINNAGQVTGFYIDGSGDHGFVDTGGVFATIDVPGATGGTHAYGINDAGQIVGVYNDATGAHGFVDTAGSFATLDVPGANPGTTGALGINDAGQVAGSYTTGAVPGTGIHGFIATPETTAVPEPDVMVVLGMGLLGLILARCRRAIRGEVRPHRERLACSGPDPRTARSPFRFEGLPLMPLVASAPLGNDNRRVFGDWLGDDEQERADLAKDGVI